MSLNINTRTDGVTVISLGADYAVIDGKANDRISELLKNAVEHIDPPKVVLDLSQTRMFVSSFVAVPLQVARRLHAQSNGRFAVCGLNEVCRQVLAETQVDQLIELYETREEALAAFAAQEQDPLHVNLLWIQDSFDDVYGLEKKLRESITLNIERVRTLAGGLARLAGDQFDLVLLVLDLPDSRGLGSLTKIRTECPDVPVVVLTSDLPPYYQTTTSIRAGAQDEILLKDQVSGPLLARIILHAIERHRVQKETRQIDFDLELAQRVQVALLPQKTPDVPGFQIAGLSRPAHATGGDFFDYRSFNGDNQLSVFLGDVSGHGFGPAILSAATLCYLRSLVQTTDDLSIVMQACNQLLLNDIPDGQFVSVINLTIDVPSRTLTYSNAGHGFCFVLDKTGEVRETLNATGPVLGMMAEVDFPTCDNITLESGDLIVLLTDGIPEAMSPDRQILGRQRLLNLVCKYMDQSVDRIANSLHTEARAYSQSPEQQDDMSVVLIRVD